MPRIVEVTVPGQQTDELAGRAGKIDQVISIRVEKGISVQPPGDVVTIAITDRSLPHLMNLLGEMGVNASPEASVSTSRPTSIISRSSSNAITRDSSESSWEELENLLNKESVMTLNSLATMATAGIIAATGILTNSIHMVVGAMLIAPGFQPIARIALGLVSQSLAWQRGLSDTLKGYLALMAGAALAGKGLARFAVEVGLVIGTSLLVFAWKRYKVEKRRMAL